jgi:SAM-dependent methyltransferase
MRSVVCAGFESESREVIEDQKFEDSYLSLISPDYQKTMRFLVRCQQCSLVFHDPQLDADDTENLYRKFRDFSPLKETPDQYFDRITTLPNSESENQQKLSWIDSALPTLKTKAGRLLDVGCGGGVFMFSFLQHYSGWSVCGIEPTLSFAELARRRLGVPVVAESYKPQSFSGVKFDLVTLNQVLEHVVDPVGFLRSIASDVAPGGAVYVEVPDVSDIGYLPPDHDRFHQQHLWIFSKDSLSKLAKKAGYEIVAVDTVRTFRDRNSLVAVMVPSESGQAPA